MATDHRRPSFVMGKVTSEEEELNVAQVVGGSAMNEKVLIGMNRENVKRRSSGAFTIKEGYIPSAEKKVLVEGKGKSVSSVADCETLTGKISADISPFKFNDNGASSSGMNIIVSRFGNSNVISVLGSKINANSNSFAKNNPCKSVDEIPRGDKTEAVLEEGEVADQVFDELPKEDGHKLKLWRKNSHIKGNFIESNSFLPWIHVNYKRHNRGLRGNSNKLSAQSKNNKKRLDNVSMKMADKYVRMAGKVLEGGLKEITMEVIPSKRYDKSEKIQEVVEVDSLTSENTFSNSTEMIVEIISAMEVPITLEGKNMFSVLQTVNEDGKVGTIEDKSLVDREEGEMEMDEKSVKEMYSRKDLVNISGHGEVKFKLQKELKALGNYSLKSKIRKGETKVICGGFIPTSKKK
ncbi:hypothetical protein MA16_Dca021779 [Dendrobium catenatum]|uniref:Uncharacterized protein n=1 Tax=Dendrobium catenatum TaxID=906689 RepID=A0A2I0VHU1_9ASPA|nr:hypothetical protein MA16_Dca021779 [Dendrobium catenatum]